MKLPLLALAAVIALTASAQAMTKQECIQAGYGCHWSKGTGGKINGWFYTTERKGNDHALAGSGSRDRHRRGNSDLQHREAVSLNAKEVMPPAPASQSSRHDSRPRSAFLPAGAAMFPLPVPESLTPQRRISEAWEGWR